MTPLQSEDLTQQNHEWLLGEYLQTFMGFRPESVLDVGCGAGTLLKQLRENGMHVQGLDQAGPRLEQLRADGYDVHEGSAYKLPFDDNSFDWVSMRHVPHHLEQPATAFAEALRVARTGLFLAEPYFDRSVASQRAAICLDKWEKQQHRRRGMFHAEVMDLGTLLGLMPTNDAQEHSTEVFQALRLQSRSVPEFEAEARALLDSLPQDAEQAVALDQLLALLAKDGLSWNGSLCLAILRA
jgi:ubiquinone/menaquinone biosynthesis C-methylase UbiE